MKKMKIEVLYFAELKEITKKDKQVFEIDKNLKDLVANLFNEYPNLKNILWDFKNKTLKSSIKIALNDEIITQNNIITLALKEGDSLAFLLPLSGG